MIFTRYLYIKEEVESALLISLLKKDKNSIRFWCEELDSEYKDTLLQIYFDFYFTNTSNIENITDILTTNYKYNLDIYLLRKYVADINKQEKEKEKGKEKEKEKKKEKEKEEQDEYINFVSWIKERNYKQLAKYILQDCDEVILPYTLKHIGVNKQNFDSIIKLINKEQLKKYNRLIYLGFIMRYFLLKEEQEKEQEKEHEHEQENITIKIKELDITEISKVIELPYLEVDISNKRSWQILSLVQNYNIDNYDYLCIFVNPNRCREELLDRYKNNWLFYASFSLLWKERIEKYKGIINTEKQKVIFLDETDAEDDLLQEFYTLYGLEPDEQNTEVQNKSIPILNLNKEYITNRWSNFYKEFANNSLIFNL